MKDDLEMLEAAKMELEDAKTGLEELLKRLEASGALDDDTTNGVRAWDLRMKDPVSSDNLRALKFLHEDAARIFGERLGPSVPCRFAAVDTILYREFVYFRGVPIRRNCRLLRLEPLSGFALAAADDNTQALLGSTLADSLAGDLARAWTPFGVTGGSVAETDVDPERNRIALPDDGIVIVTFEVGDETRPGLLELVYPLAMLKPLLPRLVSRHWDRLPEPEPVVLIDQRLLDCLARPGERVLPLGELPLSELQRLRPGTRLPLPDGLPLSCFRIKEEMFFAAVLVWGTELPRRVILRINGQAVAAGRMVSRFGRRSFRVGELLCEVSSCSGQADKILHRDLR